jgi:hypothetical protein
MKASVACGKDRLAEVLGEDRGMPDLSSSPRSAFVRQG